MPRTLKNEMILFFRGFTNDLRKGECYEQGLHVEKDIDAALDCYLQASRQDSGQGLQGYMRLGQLYEEKQDLAQALEAYLTAARRWEFVGAKENLLRLGNTGDPLAEYYCGVLFELEQNWQEAEKWYQKATDKQFALAMYVRGQLYEKDRLSKDRRVMIKKDIEKALYWYYQAAINFSKHGLDALVTRASTDAQASLYLAKMYAFGPNIVKNISRAFDYYQQAYRLGNVEAAFRVGQFFEYGVIPTREGEAEIFQNLQKACECYLFGAQGNDDASLAALERLVVQLGNADLEYKLAEIYQNNFKRSLAIKWYVKAATKEHFGAASRLQQLSTTNSDYAYEVATVYETSADIRDNIPAAFNYYLMGLRKNHQASQKYLERIASDGNPQLQYRLGYEYYHSLKDFKKAAIWWLRAAEKNSADASNDLLKTAWSAEVLLFIARAYEYAEEGVRKDISKAYVFYQKASEAGSSEATFRLGKFHEMGEIGQGEIVKDTQKAHQYYLTGAKKGHPESLAALEQIVSQLAQAELEYELAEIYQNAGKSDLAAIWYLKAANHGYENASTRIQEIVKKNGEFAYHLARAYQEGNIIPQNTQEAFIYYAIAWRNNYLEAKQWLETAAFSGDSEAQYALGVEYYHRLNNLIEASNWCMRAADQYHEQAIDYLMKTVFSLEIYLTMAKKYESGEGVQKNMQFAATFYTKAGELGDKDAAFKAGQLYQLGEVGLSVNHEKAWRCYIQAARNRHPEALFPLMRLAQEGNVQMQSELAALRQLSPAGNTLRLSWIRNDSSNSSSRNFSTRGNRGAHNFRLNPATQATQSSAANLQQQEINNPEKLKTLLIQLHL